jgi:hypothetical protein
VEQDRDRHRGAPRLLAVGAVMLSNMKPFNSNWKLRMQAEKGEQT